MPTIQILWTGGFDSTFRICQLARKEITIQPIYVLSKRDSTPKEISTMERIAVALRERSDTKAEILPITKIAESDLPTIPSVHEAYERILKQVYLGDQYVCLARCAKLYPNVELSIHRDDKATLAIQKFGLMKTLERPSVGKIYELDLENSTNDLWELFGAYTFPLVPLRKIDMLHLYQEWDLKAIMHSTWFCHTPCGNEPCGRCNPCRYSIEEGMQFRFPPAAMRRYYRRKLYLSIKSFRQKVRPRSRLRNWLHKRGKTNSTKNDFL